MRRLPGQHVYDMVSNKLQQTTWSNTTTCVADEPAPAAHGMWGPEYWPEEIRENVTVWPPPFKERQLIDKVSAPLGESMCVAVMGRKRGVGKSTVVQLLNMIYTQHRLDEVVIVETNKKSQISKGAYLAPGKVAIGAVDSNEIHHSETPFVHLDEKSGLAAVVEHINGTTIPVVQLPGTSEGSGDVIDLLKQHYRIILCDVDAETPTADLLEILSRTTTAVLVATPSIDGVYAASSTLAWMGEKGYASLAKSAIICVNQIRTIPFSTLVTISRYFQRDPRTVIRIPWDANVAAVAPDQNMDELLPTTRTAMFELAAAITHKGCELNA